MSKLSINKILDPIRIDYKIASSISFAIMILFTFAIKNTLLAIILNAIALVYIYIQNDQNYTEKTVNNIKLLATVTNFLLAFIILKDTPYSLFMVEALLFIVFYTLLALSLNVGNGLTGIVNFGVVAQVTVGAVVTGLLSVRGMPIFFAFIWGILGAAIFSGLIAMTTLRLKDDYFAIVSITIGEIFRQFLNTEPSLRARPGSNKLTTPGILDIPQPLAGFYNSTLINIAFFDWMNYRLFLGFIGAFIVLIALLIVNVIYYSPYGRLLKSIREDELVTNVYGKEVFKYKVIIMMISGLIAGAGGAMLAWIFLVITPENFLPLTTFFAWTAFIIGGRGNNKGMIVGSIIFVLLQRASRLLDNADSLFMRGLNSFVKFVNPEAPSVSISYLQLIVVGAVLILFLRFSPRGMLPEEAYRPEIRGKKLPRAGSQAKSVQTEELDNNAQTNNKGDNNL